MYPPLAPIGRENRIRYLKGLWCAPTLVRLNMCCNRIHDLLEVEQLHAPNLQEIWLRSNAICRKRLYRPKLLLHLKHLLAIDGHLVTDDDRSRAEV